MAPNRRSLPPCRVGNKRKHVVTKNRVGWGGLSGEVGRTGVQDKE